MVPSSDIHELHCLKKMENLANLYMGCTCRFLATLSVLLARVVLLENGEVHEKAYKFIVFEFEGFSNVLCDACIPT